MKKINKHFNSAILCSLPLIWLFHYLLVIKIFLLIIKNSHRLLLYFLLVFVAVNFVLLDGNYFDPLFNIPFISAFFLLAKTEDLEFSINPGHLLIVALLLTSVRIYDYLLGSSHVNYNTLGSYLFFLAAYFHSKNKGLPVSLYLAHIGSLSKIAALNLIGFTYKRRRILIILIAIMALSLRLLMDSFVLNNPDTINERFSILARSGDILALSKNSNNEVMIAKSIDPRFDNFHSFIVSLYITGGLANILAFSLLVYSAAIKKSQSKLIICYILSLNIFFSQFLIDLCSSSLVLMGIQLIKEKRGNR